MKGQTIIEVLVALGVASIIITAVTVVVSSALSTTQLSKSQNLASQYAQQGIETMREMRDTNYASFKEIQSNTYCLAKDSTSLSSVLTCTSPDTPNVDDFIRTVTVAQNTSCGGVASLTKITVKVAWSGNKCTGVNKYCQDATVISCLSDYTLIPTP